MYQVVFRVAAVALLGLLSLQCSDPPYKPDTLYVNLGNTFDLDYEQSAVVINQNLKITFRGMFSENRCYGQPNCIDPGFVEAAIKVQSTTAGSTELILGKYGLSWTDEARALSETWNGYNFELHAVRPDPYELVIAKSSTSPLPPWRITLRIVEEAPKPALVEPVTPVSYTPTQITLDPFDLDSVSIVEDTLFVHIAHGGGCKNHYFFMYMSPGEFAESNPVQASLYLRHDNNDDDCREGCQDERCWVNTTLRFDLTPLRSHHQVTYGTPGPILLNVCDYFTEIPGGKMQVLYSP